MKNLLKLTVVALSILTVTQAEALVCPAGQQVYSSPSGSRCMYAGTTGAVAPVSPQICLSQCQAANAWAASHGADLQENCIASCSGPFVGK